MEKIYYVYKITNKLTNKIYIGSRGYNGDPKEDYNYMGSSSYLKKDINKLGLNQFDKEILNIFNDKNSSLLNESDMILKYNSLAPNGYNRRKPNKGLKDDGVYFSVETKNKLSIAAKNRIRDEKAFGEKMKKVWANKSEEELQITKQKMSIAKTGKKYTKEVNLSKGRKGRKFSNESIKKRNETKKLKELCEYYSTSICQY